MRIYLKVTGEEKVDVVLKSTGHTLLNKDGILQLAYTIRNSGNVVIAGLSSVTVDSIFGDDKMVEPFGFDVFPEGKDVNTIHTITGLTYGIYRVKSTLTASKRNYFGESSESDKQLMNEVSEFTVIYLPWVYIGIGFAVFLLLLLFFFVRLRKLSRFKENLVAYKAKKGDTLPELANSYGVGWKLLAKVNNIKPPYLLAVGQTVLVPKKNLK